MKIYYRLNLKIIAISVLLLFVLSLFPDESDARRRRYSKKYIKEQALKTIQENSEDLSHLCGLEPMTDSLGNSLDLNQSEIDLDNPDGVSILEGENIDELEEEDDVTVDMEDFKSVWLSFVATDEDNETTASGIQKTKIMEEIMDWLGIRYRYGGSSRRGIDCSAFVRHIFLKSGDIMLPRVAREQWKVGDKVSRRNLELGDMIFFNTRRRIYVSHVGIYLGDNLFVHASSRYGVTISSLESKYYNKRFIGARRLSPEDMHNLSIYKDKDIIEEEN